MQTYQDDEGWWTRTVTYGGQVFSARCPVCARFVRVNKTAKVYVEHAGLVEPNARCKRHGRVMTPWLTWA